jgi:hypothetical protein
LDIFKWKFFFTTNPFNEEKDRQYKKQIERPYGRDRKKRIGKDPINKMKSI